MKWPSYLPPNCPPSDAFPPEGTFYRLVSNDPPTEADFLPVRIESPNRYVKCECQAYGISTNLDPVDFVQLRKRVPVTRNKKTAMGVLDSNCGLVKPTPVQNNTHHTWWPPDGFATWKRFKVIETDPS